MRAVIHPGRACGTVAAPPSKSMAHRFLILAGLSAGTSAVHPVDPSEDILATLDCLRTLGAAAAWEGSAVRVTGIDPAAAAPAALPCRESASTLRFMIPLCLLSGRPMLLTGSEGLMRRPLSAYEALCREKGFRFVRQGEGLAVEGRLTPGVYTVPGGISSQFATGLLLALPLLPGSSTVRLLPSVVSRPYLDMTLQALSAFGAQARWADENTLTVPGQAAYTARDIAVEGDYSSAAFFEALNCAGGDVRVTGLKKDSLQGDRIYQACFPLLLQGQARLDLTDCPDLAPVLMAVAALHHGALLTGTRRLRYKESDRGRAMAEELAKFGVRAEIGEDEIFIAPGRLHPPAEALSSHGDHRVAMALSVLCTCTGGTIDGAEAVQKSLPDYWQRLNALGVDVALV